MYRFGLWRGNSIPSLSPSSTSNWILLLVVEHLFSSFVVKRHLQVLQYMISQVFCYNSKDSVWPALLGLSEYLLSLGVFFHTLYSLAFPCPTPPLYVFPRLTCPLYTFPLPCASPIRVPFPHMSPIYVPLLHASPLCVPLLPDTHVPFTCPPCHARPLSRFPATRVSCTRSPATGPLKIPLDAVPQSGWKLDEIFFTPYDWLDRFFKNLANSRSNFPYKNLAKKVKPYPTADRKWQNVSSVRIDLLPNPLNRSLTYRS